MDVKSAVNEGGFTSEFRDFSSMGKPCAVTKQTITKGYSPYPNKHRDYEFLSVVSGSGKIVVDLKSNSVTAGDTVVINSDRIHTVTTEGEISFFCLIVDYGFICSLNGGVPPVFEEKITDGNVSRALKDIFNEDNCSLALKNEAIRSHLTLLTVSMLRVHTESKTSPVRGDRKLLRIKKAIEYMNDNVSKPFSLDACAEHTGVSKYHFCREFRLVIGQTPVEYLNKIRCAKAKALLLSHNHGIADTALLCGFSSPSYFTSVFKSVYGVSPSEIRDGKSEK